MSSDKSGISETPCLLPGKLYRYIGAKRTCSSVEIIRNDILFVIAFVGWEAAGGNIEEAKRNKFDYWKMLGKNGKYIYIYDKMVHMTEFKRIV